MRVLRVCAVMIAMMLLTGPFLSGQDKSSGGGKARGQLPANWSKLGLDDTQKEKVYKIQAEYRPKIEDLQKQLAEIRDKEKKDLEAVLTPAQKARLREILVGKAPSDDKKDK